MNEQLRIIRQAESQILRRCFEMYHELFLEADKRRIIQPRPGIPLLVERERFLQDTAHYVLKNFFKEYEDELNQARAKRDEQPEDVAEFDALFESQVQVIMNSMVAKRNEIIKNINQL